jgi:putative glycosyltransferase (TIGR04372 family)
MYCRVKKIDTKKVIIFSPSATANNKYIDKFYFANNFTVINNLISAAIIVPLSHWNFLKLDIFLNSNKEYYLIPNQIIKNFQIFIDKKIFIKQQLMQNFYVKFFQKKNHRFFSESNVLKYIKKNEFSNLKIYKKSKIALIKIRETKNSIYRNSQIDNLKISINYLLKKKFLVFRVIDKNSKNLYLKNKNYIELNIENDYEKKINALLMSRYDIFIGNISGLHTWATSLFFSRKNIFIDCINFNENNFINKKNHFLYKTIKTKNKSKISKENIQYSNLDIYKYYTNKKMKSLYYLDNTKYEIINTLKKFIKT